MDPPSVTVPKPSANWWTLVAVSGATFMLLVDVTIVQVALPRIHEELHASFTQLQWVIDAYALTLAAFVLTGGTLADRYGRKRMFGIGVAIFTVGSLLCGIAQSGLQLDLARAFQGIGGAIMFATALALIAQDFTGRDRGTAIAVWSSTVGSAVAIGPVFGGALTEGFGWRWVFFVNLPIGAAVLALVAARMTNVRDPEATRLDVAGLVTFSTSLFLLVFALLRGNDLGWSSGTIVAMLVAAAVLMTAFVVVELRQTRPMFDLSLFRLRAFTGVSIATVAIGGGMFAVFPYLTLYLQNVLGLSPFQGGLRLLAATLPVFVVPLVTKGIAARTPAGLLLGLGMTITAAGLFAMSRIHTDSTWTALLPGLLLTGTGIGLANPAIAKIALGVVPPNRSGMASGISNTFRIGGLACGVAALGAVLQHGVQTKLAEAVPSPGHSLVNAVVSGGPRAVPAALEAAARTAFVSGLTSVLLVGTVIVAAGAVAAFALVRSRDLANAVAPAVAAVDPLAGPESI
jgi:EmrB/QacA subfamily drug resistance transporter